MTSEAKVGRALSYSPAAKSGKRWFSQAEAGGYLGVTERTVRAYIARGDLPARRTWLSPYQDPTRRPRRAADADPYCR